MKEQTDRKEREHREKETAGKTDEDAASKTKVRNSAPEMAVFALAKRHCGTRVSPIGWTQQKSGVFQAHEWNTVDRESRMHDFVQAFCAHEVACCGVLLG